MVDLGRLWTVWGGFAKFLVVLYFFGRCWLFRSVLDYFGRFCIVLGCFSRVLAFGELWANFNYVLSTRWAVLGGFGLVWSTCGQI